MSAQYIYVRRKKMPEIRIGIHHVVFTWWWRDLIVYRDILASNPKRIYCCVQNIHAQILLQQPKMIEDHSTSSTHTIAHCHMNQQTDQTDTHLQCSRCDCLNFDFMRINGCEQINTLECTHKLKIEIDKSRLFFCWHRSAIEYGRVCAQCVYCCLVRLVGRFDVLGLDCRSAVTLWAGPRIHWPFNTQSHCSGCISHSRMKKWEWSSQSTGW